MSNLFKKLSFKSFVKKFFIFLPFKKILQIIKNKDLYNKLKKFERQKKIVYAITPPPRLRNIGDHAQVVAIKRWFEENFPERKVIEFDKTQVYNSIKVIKKITNRDDLIFLHSGGNLGDRGMWSERARRKIIINFPSNKIISLPQTIFFSSTNFGKKELETTRGIYNAHKDLTIIARDSFSYKLAKGYFPNCKILIAPDFVLYLEDLTRNISSTKRGNVLLCLRHDNEGILKNKKKKELENLIESLGFRYRVIDTTLDKNIPKNERETILLEYLKMFKSYKLIVTDRFHGVIFAVITKTPCIALKTVDHKLTESVKWFKDIEFVEYAENLNEIPRLIKKVLRVKKVSNFRFKQKYFNDLKLKICDD